MSQEKEIEKQKKIIQDQRQLKEKERAKQYETYAKEFIPKPKYLLNSVKAFLAGGLICIGAYYIQNLLMGRGVEETDAGAIVTMLLVCGAQLLTGLGVFDTIGKYAGAGVIVPITGFANSMVAPAIEYKHEGPVLGIGSKLFSLAGPVLVCGITASAVIGVIYYFVR